MNENGHRISSLGSLADFGTVSYSPQRITKLQQQDPDICVVVKWLQSDSQRPSRDIIAGYLSMVRYYWLSRHLLVLTDGVFIVHDINLYHERREFVKRPSKTHCSSLSEYSVGHLMVRISTDIMGPKFGNQPHQIPKEFPHCHETFKQESFWSCPKSASVIMCFILKIEYS